jgi:DNA-binding transcriptional LysR family regulator
MEEVRAMIEAGEFEVARDELVWVLSGCHDLIDAHRTLGELALADEDFPLARGHFGTAYRLGTTALKRAGRSAQLPYAIAAHREFYEAGKGLAWCLKLLGKDDLSKEIIAELLRRDPSDPLNLRGLGSC